MHVLTYCPGQVEVKENNLADQLADKATITSGLCLGGSEVFKSFRLCVQAQSQGHYTIDRLEERGVEKGSGRNRAIVR